MTQIDKPYLGQQVTVTDARGVKGPGVVTEVHLNGDFHFRCDFLYSTQSQPWKLRNDSREWFLFASERSDYGLTIDFTPCAPDATDAPVDVKKLRKGDEVWVRAKVIKPDPATRKDEVYVSVDDVGDRRSPWFFYAGLADIIRHIPAAKPLAVGDRVRITGGGQTTDPMKLLAFTDDGQAVLQYQAGDTTNVIARDVACLGRVS